MGTVITVTSGKGGTGKTTVTGGVASCLARLGKTVLCIDMDIGLRNLDISLGLSDRALMDFSDVARGRCSLAEAAVEHPDIRGLYLLTAPARLRGFCGFTRPAAAGIRESPLTISPYLDMQIFTNPQDLAAQCRSWHAAGEDIALVPTMGYYHAGHEALMDQGRGLAKRLVVSLFVNPTQFGPNEDLSAYPRDIERDTQIAAAHGADAIFIPEPASMYAEDHATWVEVPDLSRIMCGLSRPTHFRGVCTVVLKLFMITQADVAVFGQKDWQQQAILRRMVRDLNVPVRIETCPIVREEDGLALSSRNVYLTEEERRQAPWIHRGLQLARDMAQKGQTHAKILREAALCTWADHLTLGRLDYLSVVDPVSMEPLDTVDGPALMACAIRMGKARLIDNILLRD